MAWNGPGVPFSSSHTGLLGPSLLTLLSLLNALPHFSFPGELLLILQDSVQKSLSLWCFCFPGGKADTSFSVLSQDLCFSFYYFLNYNFLKLRYQLFSCALSPASSRSVYAPGPRRSKVQHGFGLTNETGHHNKTPHENNHPPLLHGNKNQ